jgi:type III secretion system low calcium response chaperone LcrH/SycD
MDPIDNLIDDVLKSSRKPVPEKDREKFRLVFTDMINGKKKPMDALGFGRELIEHMYAHGYRLNKLGNYKKAQQVFTGLTILDPDDPRFHLALGAAFHRQKKYRDAIESYLVCARQQPTNPMPLFYMSDCFMMRDAWQVSKDCLEAVLHVCGTKKEYSVVKERAKMMIEGLKKRIAEAKKIVPIKSAEIKTAAKGG